MAMKALILDDSRAMRGVLSKMLAHLGFETVQAAQGLEGLATMDREAETIRLVLSDWNMPEMNGLDFVRALRAQERFAAVPVVMVTTETEIDQMLLALSAGANEYIMKPFTADVVEEKLRLLGMLPPQPVVPITAAPSAATPVAADAAQWKAR